MTSPAAASCSTDDRIAYDSLIVATGSETSYFGHDEWEPIAPGLKTIEEATDIRHRVLVAFETGRAAARCRRGSPAVDVRGHWRRPDRRGNGRGGGRNGPAYPPRRVPPGSIRPTPAIFLVEGGDRVLNAFPPKLSARARTQLEQLGVIVRLEDLW